MHPWLTSTKRRSRSWWPRPRKRATSPMMSSMRRCHRAKWAPIRSRIFKLLCPKWACRSSRMTKRQKPKLRRTPKLKKWPLMKTAKNQQPKKTPRLRLPKRPALAIGRMIRCACICAKWARLNCSAAKARSPSPNGSNPAATWWSWAFVKARSPSTRLFNGPRRSIPKICNYALKGASTW